MRVLITGGYGFIASELTERCVQRGDEVAVIDCLTYAADDHNLDSIVGQFQHFFCGVEEDTAVGVLRQFKPDIVFHAAAESHVDRSIASYRQFVETNIVGTFNLIEGCRELETPPLFFYVSTDEVYGSLAEGRASESYRLKPSNPYAVSKMAAEHAVRAAHNTWGLPFIIARSCNNYGPRQYPEKLVPVTITRLLEGKPAPIHGDGSNVREWIHVADNVTALLTIATAGIPGEVYNVTAGVSRSNIEMARAISLTLGESEMHAEMLPDRPGNDKRYAMTNAKIALLGWKPQYTFDEGLKQTVEWYRASRKWWQHKGASNV